MQTVNIAVRVPLSILAQRSHKFACWHARTQFIIIHGDAL